MAIFPISSGVVQLSTDAPVTADPFRNGIRLKSDNTVAYAATSGGLQSQNGFLLDVNGAVVCVDATAGLPPDVKWSNGLPFNSQGALCISSNLATNYVNGLPVTSSGALSATAPSVAQAVKFSNIQKTGNWALSLSDRVATNTTAENSEVRSVGESSGSDRNYWEITVKTLGNTTDCYVGLSLSSTALNVFANQYFWVADSTVYISGGTQSGAPPTYAVNDVLMFAYDAATQKLWVGKNGVWLGANPATNTGQAATMGTSGAYRPIIRRNNSASVTFSYEFGPTLVYPAPVGFSLLP